MSSSAHLILGRELLGWNGDRFGLTFDVACHVGTLAAVLVYFRADLTGMIRTLPGAFSTPLPAEGRRMWLIAAGTVPFVVIGWLLGDVSEGSLRTPFVAASALAAGALLLFAVERMGPCDGDERSLTVGGAFVIGIAQVAAAIVPGISRSGGTIATGMALGLKRAAAARFTFLLSVPAIIAVALKKSLDLRDLALTAADFQLFAVGMATSGVVGFLAIKYLLRFLATHRLDIFAWYRLGLAAVTFVWLGTR